MESQERSASASGRSGSMRIAGHDWIRWMGVNGNERLGTQSQEGNDAVRMERTGAQSQEARRRARRGLERSALAGTERLRREARGREADRTERIGCEHLTARSSPGTYQTDVAGLGRAASSSAALLR
jgi:hypothetical protein